MLEVVVRWAVALLFLWQLTAALNLPETFSELNDSTLSPTTVTVETPPSDDRIFYRPTNILGKYEDAISAVSATETSLKQLVYKTQPSVRQEDARTVKDGSKIQTLPFYLKKEKTERTVQTQGNILPIAVQICIETPVENDDKNATDARKFCMELDFVVKSLEMSMIHTYENSDELFNSLVGDLMRYNKVLRDFLNVPTESQYWGAVDASKLEMKIVDALGLCSQTQVALELNYNRLEEEFGRTFYWWSFLYYTLLTILVLTLTLSLLACLLNVCCSRNKKGGKGKTTSSTSSVKVVAAEKTTAPFVCHLTSSSEEDILYEVGGNYEACSRRDNLGYQKN